MRATPFLGVALAVITLTACGRTASVEEPSAQVRVPDSLYQQQVRDPRVNSARRSDPFSPAQRAVRQPRPGQPKLADLMQPERSVARPPMATYARYDGRGPGDAAIPRGVSVNNGPRRRPALTRSPNVQGQRSLPSRDVVDMGLSRATARPSRSTVSTPPTLRRAPAPSPKAITRSPRPSRRPVEVAALTPAPVAPPVARALPPRPSIAALSPSLSAPQAMLDATPTGLPIQPTAEGAITLGKVPASLGGGNIRSAEIAVPAGDALEQSGADESGALGWTQAASLIRAGEVESAVDIGEFEVLITLCSGVGVITIQPTPGALADIQAPEVVCGKSASLTSQ